MESCIKCAIGPVGPEGHGELFSYSFSGASIGMRCRVCGRHWVRRQASPGSFGWSASEESEGALLPRG